MFFGQKTSSNFGPDEQQWTSPDTATRIRHPPYIENIYTHTRARAFIKNGRLKAELDEHEITTQ